MSSCTLNAASVMACSVHLPQFGLWWADCQLDQETAFTGKVQLVLADLVLNGAVVSGGSWLGRSSYRIVGGSGGWSKPLPPKGYVNDAGVKFSKIIGDAAAECGEQAEGYPAGSAGPAFDRLAGPASAVMNICAPQNWYVGEDGITRFGRRATHALTVEATRGKVDFAAGSIELMADSIASIVPGVTCEGLSAVDVEHTLDGKKIRSVLYGSAFGPATKRLQAWSKLIEQMRPFERYRGTWEYRVVSQSGDRLDLQAATSRFGLPDLRGVRVRAGLPGCSASHKLGSLVLVSFVNADPARPVVVGFDDPGSPGFLPDGLELYASTPLFAARMTDAVQCGPFSGTIIGGSTKVKIG